MSKNGIEFAAGKLLKTVAVRLEPGKDLLEGLEEAAAESGINNGLILTGIGSLEYVMFCDVEKTEEAPAGYAYGEPIEKDGPIELISLNGVICHEPEGETNLHVHITMSDVEGNAFGGHLTYGTKVLITADIIIAEVGEGIEMQRSFDESLQLPIFKPVQR